MTLYLTGAPNSLMTSSDAPQNDPRMSLGGYVSSTPVPNAALNTLFDQVSLLTLQNRPTECMAFALINKMSQPAADVEIKIVGADDDLCQFEVAAVAVKNFQMESLRNRYSLPIGATFYNADFRRAGVQVTIQSPASVGEEFVLEPFNILVKSPKTADYEGTFNAVKAAFEGSSVWQVVYISEKVFRIERKDYEAIEPFPVEVMAEEDGRIRLEFDGDFRNAINNTLLLAEKLNPDDCIGIWLKRTIKETAHKTCDQLFEEYDEKVKEETLERISLVVNYNPVDTREYSDEYNEQEYS